ncbi:MAG: bifunctional UDP-N-acetylglucosamine diphosphorylase/glucosamine-1-phosphate N-acetyltransferase GlmU [Acidimicrobiia bacterium]
MSVHVVILAAGQGKRMHSALPKVAHLLAGRPLIGWVVTAVESLAPESTVVVVGHGADEVRPLLPGDVLVAHQDPQLGTGHAARIGVDAIPDLDREDTVVVLYGDMPLITPALLVELADLGAATLKLVTADLDDPTGYGRIVRGGEGRVMGVVEHADCTSEQLQIREVNAGIYALRAGDLLDSLDQVGNDNAQGEYYLTEVVGILAAKGARLEAVKARAEEVSGINSQDQLAAARKALQRRINQELMESGVWMLDPERVYIDESVTVEAGARLYPGVHLEGETTVAAGAMVGPDVFALDSTIGADSRVWYSVLRGAVVGDGCEVGPFASLRPGTILEEGARIGTFVETKNTVLGEGAKALHLTYLGDASVGARTNIGAGTITCNYDGISKHPTEIGEDAFIGSDTMLVAPVEIGDRAITGAGSVITRDVSEGALAIERSQQREIPGYADRRQARKGEENED